MQAIYRERRGMRDRNGKSRKRRRDEEG